MSEETVYYNRTDSVLGWYKRAWRSMLANWKAILLAYGVNLFLVFLGMGPLSSVIKKAVAQTNLHDQIAGPFSYTLLMDLLNNHGEAIGVALTLLIALALPFLLWSVFCSGGYMQLIKEEALDNSFSVFWQGGSHYFFRYFRLALYLILAVSIVFLLAVFFVSYHGLNPLSLSSEGPLITKFRIAVVLLIIAIFFLTILKEIAKAKIANSASRQILSSNYAATKMLFRPKTILLGLTNAIVVLLAAALYFLLKKVMGSAMIPAVILGQLFLVFRISARFVKQASFSYLEDTTAQRA